ncbi:dTMP kinase [Maricaulis sp. CAU 1757]
MAGRFITLEGGEGAGKTTLITGLRQALEARGETVVVTREPGGTPGAEELRQLLLTGNTDRWSATSEALLMYAARVDHVERLIRPALAAGQWVLCDRFADSTIAYQGLAGGLPAERIRDLHRFALGDFHADLTLIVDLDPSVGLARTQARGEDITRFEKHGLDYHVRLRQAFLDIAAAEPERCAILDGAQSQDAVLAAALDTLEARFSLAA